MKIVVSIIIAILFLHSLMGQKNYYSQGMNVEVLKKRMIRETHSDSTIEQKVQKLLTEMTLEEKVGQMTQVTHTALMDENFRTEDGSPGDGFALDTNIVRNLIENYHIGTFLNGIAVSSDRWYKYIHKIQEINLEIDRHGIPMIYGVDHMHGANYLEAATIFPHNINIAATFNPYFAAMEGKITGIETADIGHHWIFAPVFDIGRNPRFPRYYETYGEDPLVCATFGSAFTVALQNNPDIAPFRQAACAKHFIGYSDPLSGWDRSPAIISDQQLYEYFVPPFQAAVDAGIKTFMINGGEVNSVPVHASYRLLTELLRDEMGFEGLVVTDWEDVIRLWKIHKVAETEKEAAFVAINAGIDVSMTPYTTQFHTDVVELVKEGRIPMERIDLSVARMLRLKLDIGLFDEPYPRNDRFERVGSENHRAEALNAARESLVIMRNEEKVLPLDPATTKKLVLCGPNADLKRVLAGGWTLRWIPEDEGIFPEEMPTVFSALKAEFPNSSLELIDDSEVETMGNDADAIIIVAGELPYSEGSGNIYDHALPEEQISLIKKAQQVGKPVILIVVGGRPRPITEVYEGCNAVIWAGLPGFEGGTAIAELISGKFNPSGKLPFSYPGYDGHYYTYDHKLMDKNHYGGLKDEATVLAYFGHGLSYTSYKYGNLSLSDTVLADNEMISASIEVTNTGQRDGKETIFWYITDEVAQITRPVKKLVHFEKVDLAAGETKTVTLSIMPKKHLTYVNGEGEKLLEPGYFVLNVAGESERFKLNNLSQ